ncbi:UNVERIFIED_CONTAM: hypothetical protein PYX00_005667 [Menopon gallinae]|uniref:C2H2-type domain-containing protein n=1 Tax=Menopon gallinae TaxID=328185 RepID=A0AAW2HSG5_9NEOP
MRLIKMEENTSERAKDQSPSYTSMKEAEANALRDHNIGRETVKTPIESEELMQSPYINVQRVPDANTTKNFLTNAPLLSGNELLVDINGDLISSGSISLERYIPHQYEDDLLHEDLTEDDKRLAAALVAVQLVNQQKQQSSTHILPMLTPAQLPVGSKLVNVNEQISLMPQLSGPHKGASEGESITVNSPVITSDKHSGLTTNFVQIHTDEEHQAHLESLGIHTETEQIEISTEEIEIGPNEVIKTELSDFIIQEDNIKTEVCENSEVLVLSEEEQDSDDALHDSDYENGDDKSRNSLPHKKRIPRKLKQPRKTAQSRNVVASRYKCNKCSELFPNASAFAAHKATHYVKRPYQPGVTQTPTSSFSCELCYKNFTNQWKFFEHLKSHYEPIELDSNAAKRTSVVANKTSAVQPEAAQKNCLKTANVKMRTIQTGVQQNQTSRVGLDVTITPTTPTSSSSSILHQQLTQSQPEQILWECEPCKRIFRRQKTYETHMSVAHPKQEEIEEFSEPEDMMEGIRVEVHSDDDKETLEKDGTIQKEWYREEDLHAAEADIREMEARTKTVYVDAHMCEMCNEAYETKALLNQHISQQHADIMTAITKTTRRQPNGTARKGNLSCKQCGRMFHHRNSLMYHLKSHLGERPHHCEVCGKGFFATSALKVHMRQHSGVKPFKCEFCGRNFRQWGDLKYHCISIHSDQKNFQCEYCGKNFARKYSLTVHSRIHTGERNYKCEYCEKSFRASSYLQNHRRIHTGEKPHPCDVCGKPFRVRSDMKRHMITHSKEPYSTYMVKPKRETGTPPSNNGDSKLIVQVDEQIPQISKVEELEVNNVESILPDEAVGASNRLQEELTVTYTQRDPLESVGKESNTLYVWPVYMT